METHGLWVMYALSKFKQAKGHVLQITDFWLETMGQVLEALELKKPSFLTMTQLTLQAESLTGGLIM